MFKVGHKVTTPVGEAVVAQNIGLSKVVDHLGNTWKQAELSPIVPAGWRQATAMDMVAGTEVRTPGGQVVKVVKVFSRSWIICTSKPADQHIASLMVRIPNYAGEFDWDSCSAVVPTQAWTNHWALVANKFEVTHRKAVENYTGSWYRELNRALRSGVAADQIKYCDRLDQAIAMGRVPADIVVWRAGSRKFDLSQEAGTRFVDAGFGSCSIRKDFALGWRAGVVFEIRIKAGSVGFFAKALSLHKPEDELILPRNCQYEIVSQTKLNGRAIVTVNLVAQD